MRYLPAYNPWPRHLILVAVLCMAATTGCEPSSPRAPSATAAESSAKPSEGILKRRDAPPTGVQAQFEFFAEGNGVCLDVENPPEPSVVLSYYPRVRNEIHVLQYLELCFPGFSSERPITVQLERPDSKTELLSVESQAGADMLSTVLVFLPNDPLGPYTLTARQGDLQAEAGLTLRPANEPSFTIVKGRSPQFFATYPRGETIPVALAGFPARRLAPVDIYKKSDTNAGTAKEVYQYRTSVEIMMNEDGEAMYHLRTEKDDPVGCYALAARQVEFRSHFCID